MNESWNKITQGFPWTRLCNSNNIASPQSNWPRLGLNWGGRRKPSIAYLERRKKIVGPHKEWRFNIFFVCLFFWYLIKQLAKSGDSNSPSVASGQTLADASSSRRKWILIFGPNARLNHHQWQPRPQTGGSEGDSEITPKIGPPPRMLPQYTCPLWRVPKQWYYVRH